VTTLVLVRRVVKAVKLPVVASGGAADGAGIAALLALGAEAVQLGTRFIATPEASVHENYKKAVLAAEVDGTTLIGPRNLPIRLLRNALTEKFHASSAAEQDALYKTTTLKAAALEGDVANGKVEAGQTAGLVDDIVPAGELVKRLAAELEEARRRLASL
jgi:enoyl-[acyl-carrier protein] reductase II